MSYLIDTHYLIWSLLEPVKIRPARRRGVSPPDAGVPSPYTPYHTAIAVTPATMATRFSGRPTLRKSRNR